jgi:hypothetical protein
MVYYVLCVERTKEDYEDVVTAADSPTLQSPTNSSLMASPIGYVHAAPLPLLKKKRWFPDYAISSTGDAVVTFSNQMIRVPHLRCLQALMVSSIFSLLYVI